jgi:2-methylisocitrate lyase-like PEP mutase family enzyme
MSSQKEKARRLVQLHEGPGVFLIANAWDPGSARLLAGLGYEALATSSGAAAGTLGQRDGTLTRAQTMAQAHAIAEATDLPVSADLESGFADEPHGVAETIRLCAAAGPVGASIEDATGDAAQPIFELERAVERVRAAVRAAREQPFHFMLMARSENFVRGRPDLEDTIRRLRAFESVGADVLAAPGLPDLNAVRRVCAAVTKPVNFMVGAPGRSFSVAQLAGAGVRRISLATSLYRAAMTGLMDAAREAKTQGTFGYVERTLPTAELEPFLR